MAYTPNNPLANMSCLKDLLPDQPKPKDIKETWARAKLNVFRAHERGREITIKIEIGDSVMYKNYTLSKAANKYSSKLAHRFKGPYIIEKFISPVTVLISDQAG